MYKGTPIRTTMDNTSTALYITGIAPIEERCSSAVRDLDPTNELHYIRIRSKRFEIMLKTGKLSADISSINFIRMKNGYLSLSAVQIIIIFIFRTRIFTLRDSESEWNCLKKSRITWNELFKLNFLVFVYSHM